MINIITSEVDDAEKAFENIRRYIGCVFNGEIASYQALDAIDGLATAAILRLDQVHEGRG